MSEQSPNADPLATAAERIADRLDTIDDGIVDLVKSGKRSRKWVIGLGGAAGAALVSVVLVIYVLVQLAATNRCLTVVVAATSDRTGVLAPKSKALQDANKAVDAARAKVFFDIFPLQGQSVADRATFAADGRVVTTTQERAAILQRDYDAAYAATPLPPNPKQAC